mmetsp:Transcript_24039/g.69402  ORF Transcript_24039/g.69402 Transcript_24039/m.69402 type:complete len:279 (-) Transcript_24039:2386-3222(-)
MVHPHSAADGLAQARGPVAHGVDHGKGEENDAHRRVGGRQRRLGCASYVRITNSLHLVNSVLVRELVKEPKQVTHERHNLLRRAGGGQPREAAEVRLADCCSLVAVRRLGCPRRKRAKLLQNQRWHQRIQDTLHTGSGGLHRYLSLVLHAAGLLVGVGNGRRQQGVHYEEDLRRDGGHNVLVLHIPGVSHEGHSKENEDQGGIEEQALHPCNEGVDKHEDEREVLAERCNLNECTPFLHDCPLVWCKVVIGNEQDDSDDAPGQKPPNQDLAGMLMEPS